jgi:glycyl-tRNA synthetase beta chain
MEFLLEIIAEEMPPHHVESALVQIEKILAEELIAYGLVDGKNNPGKIRTFGTCRRLVVLGDFAEKQWDKEEVLVGPPLSVAFAADGSPTQAAKGFARSQGVSIDRLERIRTEKGDYAAVKKREPGKPARDILPQILPRMISALSFPKMMRWGDSPFKFSRPITNVMCLFGGECLPFSIAGIEATDLTSGHKIHCPQSQKIGSFSEYLAFLKKHEVIVDPVERKKMILKQAGKKLAVLEGKLYPDDQLLNKLTYDVEFPYVFLGNIPQVYLQLPLEVLSTAMREGQRLFSVIRGKKQLPHFIGVADSSGDPRSLIRKGNERVLKARLEDAKFFWEQDLKTRLKDKSRKLDHVVYQEQLGSYRDKVDRLKKIVAYLAERLDAKEEKKWAVEASELCKADLVTEMVREFPSLQGKIGGLYAKDEGFPASVYRAIYEHYQPLSLEDPSPSTLTGAILSIADKLDAIVGAVGVGIEVSGSKDPFGVRRNAQGVCKIILEEKLSFSFSRLLDKTVKTYGEKLIKSRDEIKAYVINFFLSRLQFIFENQGYRYDLVKASLAPGIDNIYHASLRLKTLDSLEDSPQFEPMILIAKRVNNILRGQPKYKVNESLLQNKQERELHTMFSILKNNVSPLILSGDFARAQRMIFRLRSTINNFFDQVLVMAEDKRLRRNRLAILQEISQLLGQIADYSLVVIQG